ncbi:MAG: ester cyclase [Ardenticatenaceae bacterium]|nr:ester cyclase [Ardenticatenaceae bacterium]HBY98724.1 hypothetical protein [Chloroflexota bacterium]
MSESMTRFMTDLLEAWNTHDVERVVTFYAPEYEGVDVAQASPQYGPQGIRQMVTWYWRAFPDLHFSGDEIIVDGNRVVLIWTAHGTHQGVLMKIPPTGRPVNVRGVSRLTMKGGKIANALYIWDVAGLLRAIGLLPELVA